MGQSNTRRWYGKHLEIEVDSSKGMRRKKRPVLTKGRDGGQGVGNQADNSSQNPIEVSTGKKVEVGTCERA